MINNNHQIVLDYIVKHPVLRKIYNNALLKDFSERWLTESQKWPELYCAIIEGTKINFETFEVGLKFVDQNIHGQPRSDCISRLRDTNNVGTVFELTCIGSLILEFGERNTKPYPKFPNGQRGEVLLTIGGRSIYFEASVLSFSDEDKQSFEEAKKNDGISAGWMSGTGEGRVITKFEEKIQRYHEEFPNIFLLSQYSCLPFRGSGIDLIKKYLKQYGGRSSARNYSGVFYFDGFYCSEWIQNVGCKSEIKIPDKIINRLKNAFEKISHKNCKR
jgi:hypothetical protein